MTAHEFKEKLEAAGSAFASSTDPEKCRITDGNGTYFGKAADGIREGFGKMFYKNGDYYEGNWHQGIRHGSGVLDCADNRRFEGNFLFDSLIEGSVTWPSGQKYVGKWDGGQPNGKGLITWPDGKGYDGEWKNGKFHGIGRYWYPNYLKVCHGEWIDGKKEGRFIELVRNGNVCIVFFKNNVRHGSEIRYDARGNTFVGEWIDGKRSGDFIKTDKDGNRFRLVYSPDSPQPKSELPLD